MRESHVKVGSSEVVLQFPSSAVISAVLTTTVTVCDRLNLAVTLQPHLKIISDPVTTV